MHIVSGKGSWIRLLAGLVVLVSVLLSVFYSQNWLYLTGFIGAMLILSSITGFCPMQMVLGWLGAKVKTCTDENDNDSK